MKWRVWSRGTAEYGIMISMVWCWFWWVVWGVLLRWGRRWLWYWRRGIEDIVVIIEVLWLILRVRLIVMWW